MVSLKDFILIENKKDFDVKKFYADCEPFIQKLRGIEEKYLPKHGSKTAPDTWEIRKVGQREKPRDTPIELHKAIDDYFEKRFGWRARSQSIFTIGIYDLAAEYGPVTLCFPIGKNFQTLWGDGVKDLYDLFLFYRRKFLPYDKLERTIIRKIKNTKWHYNENLKEGYRSGHEVLINADKVYLINYDSLKEHNKIIDYLKTLRVIV